MVATEVMTPDAPAPARSLRRAALIAVLFIAIVAIAIPLLIQTGVIFGADPMAGT